jgi:hypothetical protein
VGRLTNFLFTNLSSLNTYRRDRLVEWFSFHLANVGLKFPWSSWDYVLKLPDDCIQKQFLKQVFDDLTLFHYHDHVLAELETFGKEFTCLIPTTSEPDYSFADSKPHNELAEKLLNMIGTTSSSNEIIAVLEDASDLESIPASRVFIECVLKTTSSALSQTVKLLFFYKDIFCNRSFSGSIISGIHSFWKSFKFKQAFLYDQCVRLGILDSTLLLNWLFEDDSSSSDSRTPPVLQNSVYFRLLLHVIQWNSLKISKVRERLDSTSDTLDASAKLNELLQLEKEFFLILFQRFALTLKTMDKTDHISFPAALLRLEQLGIEASRSVSTYLETIEMLTFSNADKRVIEILGDIKNFINFEKH